jgi:SAM-dependent methyltransferase
MRALFFVGRRFECPCCGWRLRTFTRGGSSMSSRPKGYCPRCNAKARHRRDWLFLQENTNLFVDQLRVLHVSPKYALSRRLTRMPNLDYVAIDLESRPNTTVQADLSDLPLRSAIFDAAICIHVLEHVDDDRAAMAELFRVIKPGGWALVSVPIRLDQPTYEDSSITTPAARKEAFGETSHVRFFGNDFADRLEAAGFTVAMYPAADLDPEPVERYGLKLDENVFLCTK